MESVPNVLVKVDGLCIQLFAELNAYNGGPEPHNWEVYISFSTKRRALKLSQDKDAPFGYDDTKF